MLRFPQLAVLALALAAGACFSGCTGMTIAAEDAATMVKAGAASVTREAIEVTLDRVLPLVETRVAAIVAAGLDRSQAAALAWAEAHKAPDGKGPSTLEEVIAAAIIAALAGVGGSKAGATAGAAATDKVHVALASAHALIDKIVGGLGSGAPDPKA